VVFARKRGLKTDVEIKAQSVTTDFPSALEENSMTNLLGCDMAKAAAHVPRGAAGACEGWLPVCRCYDAAL